MRQRIAIKNGSITMICRVIDIMLGFVARKFFISYLGVEILGINGTFTSILNSLSLAEMGFEYVIIHSLYKPLNDDDIDTVEKLISNLRVIYCGVSVFIFICGVLVSFFLSKIINGVQIDFTVYCAYITLLIGTVITYLMAHKRTFLLVQQKDYVRILISFSVKLFATFIQIVLLVRYRDFLLYTIVYVIQIVVTNTFISVYVDTHYKYNFRRRFNKDSFHAIIGDVKNIFWGKIAGYIYSSTDNIVVSAFVNTTAVGLLVNYTQIVYQLRSLGDGAFSSVMPVVGHYLNSEDNSDKSFSLLCNYSFIRYAMAMFFLVPCYVLCDRLIEVWLGIEYILARSTLCLLISDVYIHFIHGVLCDYIAGMGFFEGEKRISVIGALINISISLVLVKSLGVNGVLIGTVISQVFFWISRSVLVFHKCFSLKYLWRLYWQKCTKYTIAFYASCLVCGKLIGFMSFKSPLVGLLMGSILCECLVVVLLLSTSLYTCEFEYFLKVLKNTVKRANG